MISLTHSKALKKVGILGIASSLFLGIPLLSSSTSAQTIVKPICPGLYYEEPWNNILKAPVGCPPNERILYGEQSQINDPDYVEPTYRVVPPLPDTISQPVAYINPTQEGQVDIMLDNDTETLVSYQILGHTGERWLRGGDEVVLRNLPTPVTVTMVREDNGLLQFMTTGSDSDYLHVTLDEDPTLDDVQGVLRVQPDGEVFMN